MTPFGTWTWMARHLARRALRGVRMGVREVSLWRRFWHSYDDYTALAGTPPPLDHLFPCIFDATIETPMEPVYYYQDTWAFGKVVAARPSHHVDVASHYMFVSLLSKVLPVTMVDIRPLALPLDTLTFRKGSILDMPYADASLPSVSSMCVVEHIGLGRYGDPLDPHGTEKAIAELKRVVAPGGDLYLSLPVGDQPIVAFNAGRITSLDQLRTWFSPFQIVEERFIIGNVLQDDYRPMPDFRATGLFHLVRPSERVTDAG